MRKSRLPFRYAWDHRGGLHRSLVRSGNKVLSAVPYSVKYGFSSRFTVSKAPYSLVEGATVVQVGAPYDTLRAGRSRAARFGYALGPNGHLVVIEPFSESCEAFEAFAESELACRTTVVHAGAGSSSGVLELQVDRSHPATNFSNPEVGYSSDELTRFESVQVRQATVDDLLSEIECDDPLLVSITTNWAEEDILDGMTKTLAGGLPYCCVALGPDGELYEEKMADLGYCRLSFDDRGATYERSKAP